MRLLFIIVLLASCSPCEPCTCLEAPWVSGGLDEDAEARKRRRDQALHRPGVICDRIRLDPTYKFEDGDGPETELEWLKECCYQAYRFRLEYINCKFGKPGTPFWIPRRRPGLYPCIFSKEYERLHGPLKRH